MTYQSPYHAPPATLDEHRAAVAEIVERYPEHDLGGAVAKALAVPPERRAAALRDLQGAATVAEARRMMSLVP